MKLSLEQVEKLFDRMQDLKLDAVEVRENGDGKISFYMEETKLTRFALDKRGQRKPKLQYTP
jgi:hypothetical protein